MKSHVPPIKVTHIASGDLWAGAEVQLFTLAKTLHQFENVTVRVILLNHGELEKRLHEQGILVDVLDETSLNGIQILFRLIKLLRQHRPDVVHTHRIKENILGGLSAKFAGNIPSLRTAHGAPEHQPGWRKPHKQILYLLDWFVGRFVQSKIVAVSDDLAEILKNDFPDKKIQVIENGIDLDLIKKQTTNIKPTNISKNHTFKVGLAGRLVPVKRVDLFIQSAHYFREHYGNIKVSFHIFGDGPLFDELNTLCASLDLTDIVLFEGHCENIHQRIEELDILMMTSDHEGLPMVLLEAMALGTPIIAHAIGGIPKLLCEGRCGFLVRDQSESGYANTFKNAVEHADDLREIAGIALEQVSRYYNANKNAAAYLTEYFGTKAT